MALAPADVQIRFLPFSPAQLALTTPSIRNPLGVSAPGGLSGLVIDIGLVLVLLAYLASVATVVDRFRHARGDQRLQLKLFAYGGLLIVATLLVEGAAAFIIGAVPPAVVKTTSGPITLKEGSSS